MGRNKSRARKQKAAARSAEQRAARKCAEEREGYAALIAARQAHRRAALVVATAFVNQHMPRPERMGAFCNAMKNDLARACLLYSSNCAFSAVS